MLIDKLLDALSLVVIIRTAPSGDLVENLDQQNRKCVVGCHSVARPPFCKNTKKINYSNFQSSTSPPLTNHASGENFHRLHRFAREFCIFASVPGVGGHALVGEELGERLDHVHVAGLPLGQQRHVLLADALVRADGFLEALHLLAGEQREGKALDGHFPAGLFRPLERAQVLQQLLLLVEFGRSWEYKLRC